VDPIWGDAQPDPNNPSVPASPSNRWTSEFQPPASAHYTTSDIFGFPRARRLGIGSGHVPAREIDGAWRRPGGLTIRVYLDDTTTKVAVFDQWMCREWKAALEQASAAVLYAGLSAAADAARATATSAPPTRTARNCT
jgi:hypothetical protein